MERLLKGITTSGHMLMLLLSWLLFMPSFAAVTLPPGMPDGGCWAEPMNDLSVSLSSASFTSNTMGSVATVSFNTSPAHYPGWCYSLRGKQQASIFSATLDAPKSTRFIDYYTLSDDVDYRVWIDDIHDFAPVSDLYVLARQGPQGNGITTLTEATVGSSGKIYFALKRKLIGGAFSFPGGVELMKLYRYVYKGSQPPVAIYRLVTQQTVVPVPVECRIKKGTLIDVPFGNVDSSALTDSASTSPYHVDRALSYKCNTSLSQDIKVVLAADPAGFGDAVKTSNKDIGVVMLYKNQPVPPNGSYATTLVNGTGSDAVSFSVVKRSGTIPATGPFSGSGTLIISSL